MPRVDREIIVFISMVPKPDASTNSARIRPKLDLK